MLLIVDICAGVGVLGITATVTWAGVWGLGTPRELGGLEYEQQLMPRNAEGCAGAAILRTRSLQGRPLTGGGPGLRVFTPVRVSHWPDLADPGTLADYVRQAIVTAASGEMPPGAS